MLPIVPINQRISLNYNHLLWLSILLVSLLLQAGGYTETARYDRNSIDNGFYWLLLTGHLTHLNWTHLGLNMAGLSIVAFFFSVYGNLLQWVFVLLVSALTTGFGMYYLNPDVIFYVGLSGVLHGLFVFGVIGEIRRYPLSGYALCVLLLGKLVWEQFLGALPGSEEISGGRVIVDAHLYGALGGLLAFVGFFLKKKLFHKCVEVKDRQ